MHRAAYAALGIDAVYQRLPLPPGLFDETVRALPGSGFRGINVTIPHKSAALALADEATDRAGAIGAANTLTFNDGTIHADNTDAPALVESLADSLDEQAAGASALVLGAGGTARAAVWALLDAGASVSIWNRTPERAQSLASEFGCDHAATLDGAVTESSILVNCTTVGMASDDPSPLAGQQLQPASVVVDFVYRDGATQLVQDARTAGCAVVDGSELLARQGALSFASWFAVTPPTDVMLAALRESGNASLDK